VQEFAVICLLFHMQYVVSAVLSIHPASCFQAVLAGSWPPRRTRVTHDLPCSVGCRIGPGPGTDMLDCPESDPKRR
jgi:hypothetical protein